MLARADSVPAPFVPLAGAEVVLDALGALIWPAERLMVVADLHLEKGSAFARRGQMLPPYDTVETLGRLERLAALWRPATLVALGDSFHDRWAGARLDASALARLKALQHGRTFIWVAGNHDPDPPAEVEGEWLETLQAGPLTLRHAPSEGAPPGEVAGHLHPVARLSVRGRSIRRRCFAIDGQRAVLPALGAYAGGLNVRDPAFSGLFAGTFDAHMLGAARTYRIAAHACLPD